jgi:hypothetical protein
MVIIFPFFCSACKATRSSVYMHGASTLEHVFVQFIVNGIFV